MSWEPDLLRLEVAVEVRRFIPDPYHRLVEQLWTRLHYAHERKSEWHDWYRNTLIGKRQRKESSLRYVALLRTVVVELRWCVICTREFPVTAFQVRKRTGLTCSEGCSKRARLRNAPLYELNGKRRTLAEWCVMHCVKKATVAARLKKGLPFHAAIRTPVRSYVGRR